MPSSDAFSPFDRQLRNTFEYLGRKDPIHKGKFLDACRCVGISIQQGLRDATALWAEATLEEYRSRGIRLAGVDDEPVPTEVDDETAKSAYEMFKRAGLLEPQDMTFEQFREMDKRMRENYNQTETKD